MLGGHDCPAEAAKAQSSLWLLPGKSSPPRGENRPTSLSPRPLASRHQSPVRLYRITLCICHLGLHTLWSHLLNSHRDSGQAVGCPDTSPLGEITITLGLIPFEKPTHGQEPISAIFCHSRRCVTNHPKPTVLLLVHDSGIDHQAGPLAAGCHTLPSAQAQVDTAVPGSRLQQGGPPVGSSWRISVKSHGCPGLE